MDFIIFFLVLKALFPERCCHQEQTPRPVEHGRVNLEPRRSLQDIKDEIEASAQRLEAIRQEQKELQDDLASLRAKLESYEESHSRSAISASGCNSDQL